MCAAAGPAELSPSETYIMNDRVFRPLRVVSSFLLSLTLLLCGCSGDGINLAPVKGTIMYDGKPLSSAIVEFFPDEGRTSVGMTDVDGKYALKHGDEDGAVVGGGRVQITPGVAPSAPDADQGSDVVAPPMSAPPTTVMIPDKVVVTDGENTIDFDVTAYLKKDKNVRRSGGTPE